MTRKNELHVVLGAGGGTGRALVRELVERGFRVRALTRSGRATVPEGVEAAAGDAADKARMREVCRGAATVYNCVNPPLPRWDEHFPRIMQATIEGAATAGATYVFADDTWVYGRVDGPMTEDNQYRPVSRKGELHARLAETVMDTHRSGLLRATIGRGPELYGPAVESMLGANVFRAALGGRRAIWVGRLDMPLTPLFIRDFARGLATLGEREEALGEVWHIPTAGVVTGREFLGMAFEEAGAVPRVRALGSKTTRLLGLLLPLAREGAELVYQFEQPFIVDATKFERAFGGSTTPHREAIRQTLNWYRGEYPPMGVRPTSERHATLWRCIPS